MFGQSRAEAGVNDLAVGDDRATGHDRVAG